MLADLRSERLNVVRRLGKPDTSYRKLTFYKAHLEQDRHVDAVLLGPGHPVYGAVDERLQELLGDVAGQTAVYVDPLTEAPYRPHFYEISVRGQTTRGAATTLHAELVGVREEIGEGVLDADRYRIVPADALIDLSAHPAPPETLPAIDPGSIGDYVKATVQMDRRQAAQAERRHYADVARDYLKRSFDARVRARRTLPISNARKGNASPASNGCASRVTWPAAWVLPPEAPNDHSLAAADEADAALKRQLRACRRGGRRCVRGEPGARV